MAIRRVQVWNDDSKNYSELFRGEMLTIPAKTYIEMEDPDASQFMGQMIPIRRSGTGEQISGIKMLRKVYITEATEEARKALTCMLCKKEFKSQSDLDVHGAEHAHVMVDKDAKEKAVKSKSFFS